MSVFLGVLIGCVSATAWAIAARTSVCSLWQRRMTTLILSIDTAILVTAFFRHPPDAVPVSHDLAGSRFGAVVVVTVILIGVAVLVLHLLHRRDLIAPVVALINGLHFLGLWWAIGMSLFAWLSVALIAVAFLALFRLTRAQRDSPVSDRPLFIAGLGSALALWSACFWVLWRLPT